MKNIHLLPTEKPSRLGYLTKKGKEVFKDLRLFDRLMPNILDSENQHIYITSDEEIKECWVLNTKRNEVYFCKDYLGIQPNCKKIILTTDEALIANGVQAIDDEFLEWFVKNPSCRFVEVSHQLHKDEPLYKIIIPQEEPKHSKVFSENGNQLLFDKQGNLIKEEHNPFELPEVLPDVMFYESLQETKQETLEEVLQKYPLINQRIGFKNGAKTFEENMIELMDSYADDVMGGSTLRAKEWFEKFKKK